MEFKNGLRHLVVITGFLLLGGCAKFEESGLPGSASAMARDKMMMVREVPATFGYYRLNTLITSYPDIGLFVDGYGSPNFMAETKHESFEYLIFYYLEKRQAYVCKVKFSKNRQVQFAGPYPITDGEVEMLNDFENTNDS